MQTRSFLATTFAALLAIPFGCGLGVLVAYAIAGRDFGQLPMITVPLGIIASIVYSLWPSISAGTRLRVMLAGSAVSLLVMRLLA